MSTVALVSRLQYDAHVRLTDVGLEFTMDEVAVACVEPAIGYQARHPAPGKPLRVRRTTEDDSALALPRQMTVREAGFTHFDMIDVYVE